MKISSIVKLFTFIPWILYFVEIMFYRIHVIETQKFDKDKYIAHLNKNLFSSINIKELLLFFLYILFLQYENTTVLEILFPSIYLYLLIDFFHSYAKDCTQIKSKFLMIDTVLTIILLILYFIFKRHLYTTYSMMFIISLISSFFVYLLSLLHRKIIIKK